MTRRRAERAAPPWRLTKLSRRLGQLVEAARVDAAASMGVTVVDGTMPGVMDPFAFIPAVANTSVAITSLLYTVQRNYRTDAAEGGGQGEGHLEGHIAFQQAAVSVLYRLTYLSATGLPPSWRGMLWTWPASYRATRDFPAAVETLQLTFSAAAMTGPANLLDPSAAVFEASGKCCAGFAGGDGGRRTFHTFSEEAYQELGAYIAILRERIAPPAPE